MPDKPNPLTRGKKQKALALLQAGYLDEARALLEQICRSAPRDTVAWHQLGAIQHHQGFLAEARVSYGRALEINPENAEAHYSLGNLLRDQGDMEQAVNHYQHAVAAKPDYVDAQCGLGSVYEQLKQYAQAAECYRKAIAQDASRAELHYSLGVVQRLLGQLTEAEASYRRAIARNPNLAEAYNNLANVLLEHSAQRGEAEALYRQAIRVAPDYAEAHYNLGIELREQGRLDEAITHYRRTLELAPEHAEVHLNLAFAYLLLGRFEQGWQAYQQRRHGPQPVPVAAPSESDFRQRVVLLCPEQGIGDELFFLRFAAQLKQRGAKQIIYRPNPKIASILSRAAVIDILLPLDAPAPVDALACAVGDLPRNLGMTRAEQIPPPLPLPPLPLQVASLRERLAQLGPAPYVGVTWRAGAETKSIAGRQRVLYKECPIPLLARALTPLTATILCIQRHPQPGEVETFQMALGRPVHDLSVLNEDLEQMLALLSLIDEYVGVSNTNMHLRAAAGKTARVLVPAPPEWRWMADGNESPWFPGFRVYRQGYDGSWEKAHAALIEDLRIRW